MANIIRKATNTVAVKNPSKNKSIIGDFFDKCSLSYFQKKYYDDFKKEHYDAVKDIIHVFLGLKIHHVILQAPTQSGKTTVMGLLYDVINENESFLSLKKCLGIKKVIYLTGDNQVELSEQNMQEFRTKFCKMSLTPIRLSGRNPCKVEDYITMEKKWKEIAKTPFIMAKNGDCKKFRDKVKEFTLDNTLIMVDESHYGTKDINSQVNKLFQEFDIDFSGDPKKLKSTNTYVLSVSATPYNEEFADKINNDGDLAKGIVNYKSGKGYVGFPHLWHWKMIDGLKDNSIAKERKKFVDFLKKQRNKMDNIFEETKERHAVIMRMQGTKTLLAQLGEKELSKISSKYGFKLMIVDCGSSGKRHIDYDNAYDEIRCSQFDGGENILVIVKQGFSYGIVIPKDVKNLISTVYDYRPSSDRSTPDSTEQGLLGRMSGYYKNGMNKYLKLYIAEDHLQGLKSYYIDRPPSESPMPSKNKGGKIECTFEEWDNGVYKDEKDKLKHIELWNNDERKPLIFAGEEVDSFFERHTEFDYDELFDTNGRAKVGTITPIADAFNKELLKGRFDIDSLVDARRHIGNNSVSDKISATLGFVTPILSNASRRGWRTVDNAKKNKEGWAFVIDIKNRKGKKGIEIRTPYGHFGFSKETIVYKERENHLGYQKSELALAMA